MKQMKVAIVGAGTCGLYLAWRLAQMGHKAVVFEKKKNIAEVGQKPCSALISERLRDFIPLGTSLIENKIDTCLLHFPKKTITLHIRPTHLVINRQKLIETMFELARNSGAEILFDRKIQTVPKGFDRIIGCDGGLSWVREHLALPQPFFRLGLQLFQNKKDKSRYVETWPSRAGFFWKIPRGKQTEYGAIGPQKTVKKDFKNFLCKFSQNFHILEYEALTGALVPQGLCLPKSGMVTLCGDGAGLTKPWSGGGVIWGLTAADILLRHFPDFGKYYKEARAVFQKRLTKGNLLTRLVYFFGQHLPYVLPSEMAIDNDLLVGVENLHVKV